MNSPKLGAELGSVLVHQAGAEWTTIDTAATLRHANAADFVVISNKEPSLRPVATLRE